MKLHTLPLLGITLASLATGCTEAPSETDLLPLPPAMASAARDGAKIDIYELTPGDLAVVANGDLPEGLEGRTPVEIFETISGTAAPAELVARQAAIASARGEREDEGGVGSSATGPAVDRTANLTAAAFQAQYCAPGAVDFDHCWLNRTGDTQVTFNNINWIHSHVNAYRGTVTHFTFYRAFAGSWQLNNTDDTTGSSYVSTFSETDNGDYEIAVTYAAGDGYHIAIHGDN